MTKLIQYIFVSCILCQVPVLNIVAQPVQVHISFADSTLSNPSSVDTVLGGIQNAKKYVQQVQTRLILDGFVTASVDTMMFTGDRFAARIFPGRKYYWKNIEQVSKLLEEYENKGYPFASLQLYDLEIIDSFVNGKISIIKNELYRLDSIRLPGKILSPAFLRKYLDISNGEVYNQKKLEHVDADLATLEFIEIMRPAEIVFYNTGAVLTIYAKRKHPNQFNGIIGILPSTKDHRSTLTGEAQAILTNNFGNGEHIRFNWQHLQNGSSNLLVGYVQPYLFKNMGVGFEFNLFQKDSAYLNIDLRGALTWQAGHSGSTEISFHHFTGHAIAVDTTQVMIMKQLPEEGDLDFNAIGIKYKKKNLSENFYPVTGSVFSLGAEAGIKKLKSNYLIASLKENGFDYASLYEHKTDPSFAIKINLSGEKYFSLSKNSTLRMSLNGASLITPDYYVNELWQLGGYTLLRGFNDNSIYAAHYIVGSSEYRYRLSSAAYFQSFIDVGITHYHSISHFISAGLGLTVSTGNGILNASYALGKRNDQPLDLSAGKIHIRFVFSF